MGTYIALCNWTDRGAQQVKDSPRRFDAAKKLLREMGGDIKAFYRSANTIWSPWRKRRTTR